VLEAAEGNGTALLSDDSLHDYRFMFFITQLEPLNSLAQAVWLGLASTSIHQPGRARYGGGRE